MDLWEHQCVIVVKIIDCVFNLYDYFLHYFLMLRLNTFLHAFTILNELGALKQSMYFGNYVCWAITFHNSERRNFVIIYQDN